MLESQAWQLSGSVSLRPEPFGALAYDFHTRRLSFLKTPRLVELVRHLGGCVDVRTAMDEVGVSDPERPAYLAALDSLAHSGILQERAG